MIITIVVYMKYFMALLHNGAIGIVLKRTYKCTIDIVFVKVTFNT